MITLKNKCARAGCRDKTYERLCAGCKREHDAAVAKYPLPAVPPHPRAARQYQDWVENATPEEIAALKAADAPYEAAVRARHKAAMDLLDRAEELAVAALGDLNHPIVKALRDKRPYCTSQDYGRMVSYEWERFQKDKRERERVAAAAVELARKGERAKTYLRSESYGPNVPEDDKAAIEMANTVRENALIAEQAPREGEFVEYNAGAGCPRPCAGWDGKDNRCQCGNRRVYWESDGDFEDMRVWAQADGG